MSLKINEVPLQLPKIKAVTNLPKAHLIRNIKRFNAINRAALAVVPNISNRKNLINSIHENSQVEIQLGANIGRRNGP